MRERPFTQIYYNMCPRGQILFHFVNAEDNHTINLALGSLITDWTQIDGPNPIRFFSISRAAASQRRTVCPTGVCGT